MSDDQIIRVCRHGSDATRCVVCEEQPGGLANADSEAAELAAKAGLLNFDGPALSDRPDLDWKPLASFSAEQTAAFLGSGDTADLGRPTIHDPDIRARMERQHTALRRALYERVIPALESALVTDSYETRLRLHELAAAAEQGDPRASKLMGAMLGELLTQALQP